MEAENNLPLPPPPPPSVPSLNSIRTTYINLFNQILDSSININCICKTTVTNSIEKSTNKYQDHSDFMDDDEVDSVESDQNDIEMTDASQHRRNELSNLVHLTDNTLKHRNKRICDLSCFENLKYIHNLLKNCFKDYESSNTGEMKSKEEFEAIWNSFEFLRKDPKACDYYGTTIYHYAASDNNFALLNSIVQKYPEGVLCLDSKGMTPIMRAAQRNNYKCAEFLLNETNSEINGSLYSTYTPLWFGVSNGYTDLVKLLLDYNANPSINDKHKKSSLSNEEMRNEINQRRDDNNQSSFLFSPIRASIVYSQIQIMNHLLEYGANVSELFSTITLKSNDQYGSISNEDYVNALKFFHRQFGHVIKLNEKSLFLNSLNEYIENQNVYRYMLIEFVKNVYINIKLNKDLTNRIDQFLTTFGKNSIDYIINMTEKIESPYQSELEISEYLTIIDDFMSAIDQFISSEQIVTNENNENIPVITNRRDYNDFVRNLIQKPNHHKNLFEFSTFLMNEFFHPKTLKELARFNLRKAVFKKLNAKNFKYNKDFLKSNNLELHFSSFGLPRNLVNYLLHRK